MPKSFEGFYARKQTFERKMFFKNTAFITL